MINLWLKIFFCLVNQKQYKLMIFRIHRKIHEYLIHIIIYKSKFYLIIYFIKMNILAIADIFGVELK